MALLGRTTLFAHVKYQQLILRMRSDRAIRFLSDLPVTRHCCSTFTVVIKLLETVVWAGDGEAQRERRGLTIYFTHANAAKNAVRYK